MAIHFFSEGINFHLSRPRNTTTWIQNVIKKERRKLHSLNYVFCSDEYLARLNTQFRKQNTLTDILTFEYSTDLKFISGEIYISIQRVRENAARFKESF